MSEVKVNLEDSGEGTFYIIEGTEQLAEMMFSISGNYMTVYHTEVVPQAEGKGLAKQLLDYMVAYVRERRLKVIPFCPYVHLMFHRHTDQYADIWQREEVGE